MKRRQLFISALITLTLSIPLAFAAPSPSSIPFELTVGGQTKTVTLEDLGVVPSQEKKEVGMLKSVFSSVFYFLDLIEKDRPYEFIWNSEVTEERIRKQWHTPRPRNARFVLTKEGSVEIKPEQGEYSFETDELIETITEDYPDFNSYTLDLLEPSIIKSKDLAPYRHQVESLINPGLRMKVNGEEFHFPAQLKDIVANRDEDGVEISLDEAFMEYILDTLDERTFEPEKNLLISEANKDELEHTVSEGRVGTGLKLNKNTTRSVIEFNIRRGKAESNGLTVITYGGVVNETGHDLGKMELIATGRSNFKGSPDGRDHNVRKALDEHYNNILIPPGEYFSFNSFLGPMSERLGWQKSLGIFGTDLRPVVGGGICQVATTMYRAALDAGLDIQRQRNHSLWVHYYEAHGNGLDATIYLGGQDLSFVNNTGNYILIEAFADGDDAIINFYGESDGRTVEFDGPYTASNQTEEVRAAIGGLSYKQIAWKYTINWPNGESKEEWLISTYKKNAKQIYE